MGERELKAFALAPLPVLVLLLSAMGVNVATGHGGDATGADIFRFVLILIMFAYGATLFVGVPIHLVLRRFRKTGLIEYLSLSALPFVLFAGVIAVWRPLAPVPASPVNPFGLYMQSDVVIKWTLVFALFASISAATFWYAGVRQPKP